MNQLNEHSEGFDEIDNSFDYIVKKYKIEEQHYASFLKMKEFLTKNSNLKQLKEEINKYKEGTKEREEAEKAYIAKIDEINKRSVDSAQKYRENVLKHGNARQKNEILRTDKEILEKKKQSAFEEFMQKTALIESESATELERLQKTSEARANYLKECNNLEQQLIKTTKLQTNVQIQESEKAYSSLKRSGTNLLNDFNKKNAFNFGKALFSFDPKSAANSAREAIDAINEEKSQLRASIDNRNIENEGITEQIKHIQSIKDRLESGELDVNSETISNLVNPIAPLQNQENKKSILNDLDDIIKNFVSQQQELNEANAEDLKRIQELNIEADKENLKLFR